jgi:hypothetical protein
VVDKLQASSFSLEKQLRLFKHRINPAHRGNHISPEEK